MATWVRDQRKLYTADQLPVERGLRLESMGFEWKVDNTYDILIIIIIVSTEMTSCMFCTIIIIIIIIIIIFGRWGGVCM